MKFINLKAILPLVLFTLLGSCEGSMGCSGCSGCGMEPIPGDFPLDKRVENAAQAHVSAHTIEFIENNYDPLINYFFPDGLFFDIPPSTENITLIGDVDICPDGGCSVNLQVINLTVTPVPPSSLRIVMQLRIVINDLPVIIHQGLLCLWPCSTCDCLVDFNTAESGRPYNGFQTNFVFNLDTITGYMSLRMHDSQITDEIENDDLSIVNSNLCGIGICSIANLGFIKSILIDQITSSLTDSLEDPMNESMCRTCESGCPEGSTCDGTEPDDYCIYPDDTCVPVIMGLMGRMDAGGLLSSFSPGTVAVMDLLAAAGGYAGTSADPEAIDIGLYGGAEGAPVSDCARKAPVPCETDTDCAGGYTCGEVLSPPSWLYTCRRCASGCPDGSSPRDGEPCRPNPEDPDEDYDPSQPCMRDDGTCVPIRYCLDGGGQMQEFEMPGAQVVPVAESLKVDRFTHCVYCDSDDDCTAPYTCDMLSVCTMEGDPDNCQSVTEPVMIVAGISRTFLKRALMGMASSGALCLEIPPGAIAQLNSEMIVTALPTLGNLVWENQPVALVLRPTIASFGMERPELDALDSPNVEIGDKPLLNVILREVTIDFYIWLEETYSRFLSTTFDLELGVDILARGGTLTPIIRSPNVTDVRAYNNDLLQMDNEALRNTIAGLIELAMGFLPALDPIDIPEIEMFNIAVPDGGVTHIRESGEDFLVLYVNLEFASTEPPPPPSPYPAEVETSVELLESYNPKVDLERGTAAMFSECDSRPYFLVKMSALSPSVLDRPIEYRYRLNGGPWTRWNKNETARIESRQFIFQGRHVLEAQARVCGMEETKDPLPAIMELLVDGIPPEIASGFKDHETIAVSVSDMVSPPESIGLWVKKKYLDGRSSDWTEVENADSIRIPEENLMSMEIIAIDEAGNVSTETFAIRGRVPPSTDDASDCMECAAVGSGDGDGGFGFALLILVLASIMISRKKKSGAGKADKSFLKHLSFLFFLSLPGAALIATAGCSCSENNKDKGPCADNQGPECCLTNEDCGENIFCCTINHQCMEPPSAIQAPPAPDIVGGKYNEGCDPGFFCEELPQFTIGETEEEGCWFDWSCCEETEPLLEGRLGTYLGMDVREDGADPTIWISGYSPGESESLFYGDLVAGQWDGSARHIQWEIIDGLPEDGFITNSTSGWRSGITEEGDDVGLYSSLLLDASSNPMIAYYDRTNRALKFIRHDGSAWLDPVVVDSGENADAGRYAEMIKLPSQAPAVLYRSAAWEAREHPGATGYRVVHLSSHLKTALENGGSWTVETVTTQEETPCWGGGCPEGYVCRMEDLLCWPPADEDDHEGCDACSVSQACLSDLDTGGAATGEFKCEDILTMTDVPEGIAVWTSAALTAGGDIEAVYYDRTGGNLVWIGQQGGLWQEPVILDGDENDPDPSRHGDRGWYPSIAIDGAGNRHIVYVDGLQELFVYMMVDAGGNIVMKEVVDDGMDQVNVEKDIVGDNSSIQVDPSGRIRAIYQNTSDGILLMAVKNTDGTWGSYEITDRHAGYTGYYALQRIMGERSYVAHFFFNFESPPTGVGVGVLVCTVEASGDVSCRK